MPYIPEHRRTFLHSEGAEAAKTSGELNYLISDLLVKYLDKHKLSYQTCNDIVGALDNAKAEFKRRVQDPYEDTKITENGDIGYERFAS